MNWLFAFLIGYALGNFSPSYLLGKSVKHIDIREHGSGNAGATNVIRTMGWRYGALVFILDMLKGIIAVWFATRVLGAPWPPAFAGLGVVLGHNFPVLLGFRGGKGIAASLGILLFLFPVPTVIAYFTAFLIIIATRFVSVGSLSFIILMMLYTILSGQPFALILLSIALALLAFLRHNENIQRLIAGTENKLSFKKKEKK
ncbi:MAG: glycerol-3-phosphate 1-O-acyltransferase PlsY [Anaerolineaceae bacterium]|nr:glycerol-3-phosphate 1-O-acyltransferase PlsY [Anaerolineaceae bacterium]